MTCCVGLVCSPRWYNWYTLRFVRTGMPTREFIERVREGLKKEGKEERKQRLIRARILTDQGEPDPHFFSSLNSKGDEKI